MRTSDDNEPALGRASSGEGDSKHIETRLHIGPGLKIFKIFIVVPVVIGLFLTSAYLALPNPVIVDVKDDPPWFFPAILEIEPGTTVTWHLYAPAVHPIMTIDAPEEIHLGPSTESWTYTFTEPGIYVYICPLHPYMKGVIGVGQKVPREMIPPWVNWPPEYEEPPAGLPRTPGKGKIWLAAQFHKPQGKSKPGTLIVIDAETWGIEKIIDDQTLNNPHNLWEVNDKIVVTNWFDLFASIYNKDGELENRLFLGQSPAHVHARDPNKIYVTLQGDDGIAILDQDFEVVEIVQAPEGPHGHWMSADGRLMALASTGKGTISVWDTSTDSIIFEEFVNGEIIEDEHEDHEHEDEHDEEHVHIHSLPLMAGITADGDFAFIASSHLGKFYVFDVEAKQLIKSFDVGSMPIQTVPSPDKKHVLVSLTGSGEVAIISTENWDIVKRIKNVGFGAHGVFYGEKQGGGWYAYVSSKFVTWITVIDMDNLEIAGYIPLPRDAWGGQGILVVGP